MKRYLIISLILLSVSMNLTSCSTDDLIVEIEQPIPPEIPNNGNTPDTPGDDNPNDTPPMSSRLKISIGSTSFSATLENNATVTAFKALLPITVNMEEMNGNEKYYYLPENLPAASSNPGTIRAGDLMLYGSSCMVFFYEKFSTSYSYTRLGRVDNPSGLASVLGLGSATVTFELQ